MLLPLVVFAGLVTAGAALERKAAWVLLRAPKHDPRAEALWTHAIVRLIARNTTTGDDASVTVLVVGLRDANLSGRYTGMVTGNGGTTFKEGTFLEFGPEYVAYIEA